MPVRTNPFWHKVPSIRLLLPLSAGIIIQWYFSFAPLVLLTIGSVCLVMLMLYQLLPLRNRFSLSIIPGIAVIGLLVAAGAILIWHVDIRHQKQWIGHNLQTGDYVITTLKEPLVEKPGSYKALARINHLYRGNRLLPVTGNVILYFKKDSSIINHLDYGSQLIFNKPLQVIKNAGNPGSFNYQQYSLMKGITHQVYLTNNDFVLLQQQHKSLYHQLLFSSRSSIITILRRYIHAPKEQGLAEALLIGYKDDLDKNLVQSYSNTGVVHIIAISGLHLGVIYGLLYFLTKPLKRKQWQWLRLLIILGGLWLFSLLAGAQPSVLRSTVMFSAIAFSMALGRKSFVYNTLALSAFVLLCFNPFWLWDVGFQLSYAAVLSIIIFFRPVYNWLYFQNKSLDYIWKLLSVSIAAQVLTLPVSIYHFHQFPLLFLFANLLAVPLSFIILTGELFLCAFFFILPVAKLLGAVAEVLMRIMNDFIERLDTVSFAVWNGLSVSVIQAILLYGFIAGISWWLLSKKRMVLRYGLISLLLFTSLRSFSFINANGQRKIIVYNVPEYCAIDVINGRSCSFIGDDI
ncbi:MAG: ComEC/Rec2 family competence protein, partial [Flavisolibacter sp.]|nr:ComEC/Rec2 family competence protein [Flavisolibacter sp.]